MKEARAEGLRWLRQPGNDLAYAELGVREGFYAQECFHIPTRYPNGLPGVLPCEVYTRRQAEGAVEVSRRVIAIAREALGD